MGCEVFKAQAPGSFMLFGEHAVLRGKFAVVAALNQWINVSLTPQDNHYIEINSALLGNYKTDIKHLRIEPPFQFVLGALMLFKPFLKQGCRIHIESEFSHQMGLGSSAAVSAAVVAVLALWLDQALSKQEIFLKTRQVIRKIQGQASGADVAAAVYGGVIAYQSDPIHVERLPLIEALHLIYCGYKTPTSEVIAIINDQYQSQPQFYDHLFECIGYCSLQAIHYIKEEKWSHLGNIMKIHHSLQKALGSSDDVIDEIIYYLDKDPAILGAKISGSGLGDCIVALGELSQSTFPKDASQRQRNVKQISAEVTALGLNFVN